MTKCPYCGSKINTAKELPDLTPREFVIFNTLLSSGRKRLKAEELMPDNPGATVRVAIHNINKKIKSHGMVIKNLNGTGYRLEEL